MRFDSVTATVGVGVTAWHARAWRLAAWQVEARRFAAVNVRAALDVMLELIPTVRDIIHNGRHASSKRTIISCFEGSSAYKIIFVRCECNGREVWILVVISCVRKVRVISREARRSLHWNVHIVGNT